MARKQPLTWIPDNWKEPLRVLLSLEADELARIAESIRGTGVPASTDDFIDRVAPQLDPQNPKRLAPVIWLLVSLEMTRAERLTSPQEFAREVIGAARNSKDVGLPDREESGWDEIAGRIADIFSCSATLGTVSKAANILFQNDRMYQRARILTDLRPVFGDSPQSEPLTYVAQHTLKLEYMRDGAFKRIFLVLDIDDLEGLKEVVERAIQKDRTLRTLMQSKDMQVTGNK